MPDPRTAIDWSRVRASGRTFAYVRATYGMAPDPGFASAWQNLKSSGLVRGAWQVLRHDENAVEQATQFLKIVELQRGDLPPMIDLERMATSSPTTVIDMLRTWLSVVESELEARHGCKIRPIIRTSSRAWPVRKEPCAFQDYTLWIIDAFHFEPQVPKCLGAGEWQFHQYSVGTRGIPGISGPVALDRFNPCKLGDRGRAPTLLKHLLAKAKFGFGVTDTCEFDDYTRRATTNFQEARGLVQDGMIGPKTFAELHWP
ncbi:MAG TPA: GH25 family lysozyme [Kofleriaceae bacterium]